jgi:hypothetical protein
MMAKLLVPCKGKKTAINLYRCIRHIINQYMHCGWLYNIMQMKILRKWDCIDIYQHYFIPFIAHSRFNIQFTRRVWCVIVLWSNFCASKRIFYSSFSIENMNLFYQNFTHLLLSSSYLENYRWFLFSSKKIFFNLSNKKLLFISRSFNVHCA